jgi:hypothetical protein
MVCIKLWDQSIIFLEHRVKIPDYISKDNENHSQFELNEVQPNTQHWGIMGMMLGFVPQPNGNCLSFFELPLDNQDSRYKIRDRTEAMACS